MAAVGQVPRSPLRTVGPVFVTPLPASTAKLAAVPSPTGDSAALAVVANTDPARTSTTPTLSNNKARFALGPENLLWEFVVWCGSCPI
jgi:hypothetical protein